MKKFLVKHKVAVTCFASAVVIGVVLMSFQDSPFVSNRYAPEQVYDDTIPDKKNDHMTMKEFDDLMNNLDVKISKDISESLKNVDFEKIQQDVEKSLKGIDIEKIRADVEKSLKDIDVDKILTDVRSSMKDVDLGKHSEEINKAMSEAKEEIEKARVELKNIDMKDIEKEMKEAKAEIEKSKAEFKNIDVPKIMKEAEEGIKEAKEELKQTKAMFNEMEKDGLINQKEGFSIEFKDKELYINGKKQSQEVWEKYHKYVKDDRFKITIDKE